MRGQFNVSRDSQAAEVRLHGQKREYPGKAVIAASIGNGERPCDYVLLVEWDSLKDHNEGFRRSDAFSVAQFADR
jgi:hypothetical protein